MDSLGIAAVALACSIVGIVLGRTLRGWLSEEHWSNDAKDVLKTATGMIATLVALVIGLLVSSSKSSFDQAGQGITQIGAKIIMLDDMLARYGAEADEARALLRRGLGSAIARLGSTGGQTRAELITVAHSPDLEAAYDRIRGLKPSDDEGKDLRDLALQLGGDILQARWVLIEGTQAELPSAFLVLLVAWQSLLFLGLGLQTPGSPVARTALLIAAASMAGALFLILEMSRPMDGIIRTSVAPLQKAEAVLAR